MEQYKGQSKLHQEKWSFQFKKKKNQRQDERHREGKE